MQPHSLARFIVIISAVVLVLTIVVALPVRAADNDNTVEFEGLGHVPIPDRYICEEESYPYRDPINPRADQSIIIRARSFTQDLTSVTIWYTTDANATEQSQWSSITTAVTETTWLDCMDDPAWDMDIWRIEIPAQTSRVWYQIAYTDGTVALWQRASGESEDPDDPADPDPSVFHDPDWRADHTLLTYTPPSSVYVGNGSGGTTWGYDRFTTIQNGINAVATGGQVNVHSGIYTESLTITRPLTLQRYAASETPVIHGPCSTALINVSATPVIIANLTLKVNQATCSTGLRATGNYERLRLAGNTIESTGPGTGYITGTRGIDLNGPIALGVDVVGNIIRPETVTATAFEDGLRLTNAHGTIGGPSPNGNLITAHTAIQATEPSNVLRIEGNTLYGRTRLNNLLFSSGFHYFISNVCRTGDSGDSTVAPGVFALLEVNTVNAISLSVQNNEFRDFVNYGLFLGNFLDVLVEHNTFMPLEHPGNTDYRDIHLNTKPHGANPLPSSADAARLTLWDNTFYGNSANPDGGVALELANHASTGASAFQNIAIGGSEEAANSFAYNIKTVIRLDPSEGDSDSLPMWRAPSCPDCSVTTMAPVFDNFDARENEFGDSGDTYKRPADMELTELASLEDRIDHQVDYAALGFVRVRSLNVYVTPRSYLPSYTTEPLIKRGIDAADSGDTVNVTTGVYTENIVIDKTVTLAGMGQSNSIVHPAISNPDCHDGGSGVLCSGGPAASNLVQVQADNVTLRDLTLDGDAPGLTSGITRNGADLDARNGLVLGAFNNLAVRNSTIRNVYLDSLYLTGGNVTMSGATLNNQDTVFDQTSGALTAYANSIISYTTALTQTGGTRNLRHNWWGTFSVTPTLVADADWRARLGAPIMIWTEGSNGAALGDASLTGGTGTAVIVDHGRSFTGAPFGNTIFDYGSMCSDYYDFFTVNGSGTWSISVPVDISVGGCLTQTLEPGKIYWIPPDTPYDVDCTPFDNKACWDLLTTNVITGSQNITVTGLTPTQLGGTQFVAGTITGSDPTVVAIVGLAATTDRSSAPAGVILVSALVAAVSLVLVIRRRR